MVSNYLSASELADLIECEQNSFACMRRWLDRNAWPYAKSITGFPKVSRAYHDARMSGTSLQTTEIEFEPNFAALT